MSQTLADPLAHAVANAAADLAVVDAGDGRRLTYAETADRCARLVGGLRGLGLERGDRVAFLGAGSHRYLEAHQAVPAGGLVLVPLNVRHAEPELRFALEDSGARVLLTDRDLGGLADAVEQVVRLPDGYERLLAGAEPTPLGADEDDLAALYYTGGTTGRSKGVMLSHRNLVANALHVLIAHPLSDTDVWLLMSPLFHVAGTYALFSTVWAGGRHVVMPAFDPGAALDLIASERVTATLGVPTMVAALVEEQRRRPRDISSLRLLAHAGAPIATETILRAAETFPDAEIAQMYGATETAPLVTVLRHEQRRDAARLRSCGRAVPGVSVGVLERSGAQRVLGSDATGAIRPAGEVGEVAVRGPNVMLGYWNLPEQTAAVMADGWYRTGDLGYLDGSGYLHLVDRAKDMIVTGGENVYSTEVEDALYAHPAVLEAAVFGVPDDRWGEAVQAVVVLRSEVPAEELIAHCRERIAGYKVPKRVAVSSEPLPKSGPGKILKRELREPYWAERDTRVAGS